MPMGPMATPNTAELNVPPAYGATVAADLTTGPARQPGDLLCVLATHRLAAMRTHGRCAVRRLGHSVDLRCSAVNICGRYSISTARSSNRKRGDDRLKTAAWLESP